MNKNKKLLAVLMAVLLFIPAFLTACDNFTPAEPTLTKIEVKTAATKTVYEIGEEISYAGLVIQKVMSDGTKADLAETDYDKDTDYVKTTAGIYTVTITLISDTTKTTAYSVTVKAAEQGATDTISIILGNAAQTVIVNIGDFEYLVDVLLSEAYADEFEADVGLGSYGYFVNSLKGVVPDPYADPYEYVGVYSTLEEFYSDEWGKTAVVGGITYYSASVGISFLPVVKDAKYLFIVDIYVDEPYVDPFEPTLLTSLSDKTTKGERIAFSVEAFDYQGVKIPFSNHGFDVDNGGTVSQNYCDEFASSYFLFLQLGTTVIIVSCNDGNGNSTSKTYTIEREAAQTGDVIGQIVFSLEATTIGRGYIIEPTMIDILFGDNGASLLLRVLTENRMRYRHTGTVNMGFYLSAIRDIPDLLTSVYTASYVESVIHPKYLEEGAYIYDGLYTDGELGEMDFTWMSGWMYMVDNEMVNYGFTDWYPQDGSVCRVQFTLWGYGADLSAGFMGMDSFFPVVNRDMLVTKIAGINMAGTQATYGQAYDDAMALLQTMGMEQTDLDNALAALIAME